jgi:hypothetical protein
MRDCSSVSRAVGGGRRFPLARSTSAATSAAASMRAGAKHRPPTARSSRPTRPACRSHTGPPARPAATPAAYWAGAGSRPAALEAAGHNQPGQRAGSAPRSAPPDAAPVQHRGRTEHRPHATTARQTAPRAAPHPLAGVKHQHPLRPGAGGSRPAPGRSIKFGYLSSHVPSGLPDY